MQKASAIILVVAAAMQSSAIGAQTDPVSRFEQWEGHLRDHVNAELTYPIGAAGASGDVFVAFRVGPNGKPTDVSVQNSSGLAIFDQAAVYLVSHLGRVGPIPSASGKLDRVILKISYGEGARTMSEAIQVATRDRQEQLVNERRDRALVSSTTQVAENH